MSLEEKLGALAEGSSPEERENYKLLLCMAAGGLAPRGTEPVTEERKAAFLSVIRNLKKLGFPGDHWVGRPDFMTGDLLEALQAESREVLHTAKPADRYLLGCGGPVADQFALSPELSEFVGRSFPSAKPTGIASYIYYEEDGQGLDPHVDTEIYTINVILMLEHQYQNDPSALLLYDDLHPRKVLLKSGEMAIINAGSVVHARQDVGLNERVRILTVGFN